MSPSHQQKSAFLESEGDAWFRRNGAARDDVARAAMHDPLIDTIDHLGLTPARVLEIGASNGWRLEAMRRARASAHYSGLEPSADAVSAGTTAFPEIALHVGSADSLPFDDRSFDLVMFGFCLYLCDRTDLFRIAAEADRVLDDGGAIAIYDFHVEDAYQRPYSHRDGLASFKMDHSRLFTWNPAYQVVMQDVFAHPGDDGVVRSSSSPDDQVAVTVLKRSFRGGWPEGPTRA